MSTFLRRFVHACCITMACLVLSCFTHSASAQQMIVYVDAASSNTAAPSPTNKGDTWDNAYKYLQNGLLQAALLGPSQGNVIQIWVADGVYFADDGHTPNDPDESFVMQDFVDIYGGFHGNPNGETLLNQRDPYTYITLLSGDIDQDNILDADNSRHVVYAEGIDDSKLDGFIIKHGYAADSAQGGGGLLIRPSQISISGSSPKIVRCTFEHNRGNLGGAVRSENRQGSAPAFFNCIFRYNEVVTAAASFPKGGAIYATGGAGCAEGQTPTMHLTNCLFHHNTYTSEFGAGGAIYWDDGEIHAVNCTIANNTTGLRHFSETCAGGFIRSSIIWGNGSGSGADQIVSSTLNVDYCTVQASIVWPDSDGDPNSNSNSDPLFVNPPSDFRLGSTSPCINTGAPLSLPSDDDDLDQDNVIIEAVPELDRLIRIVGPVDKGVYELQDPSFCAADVHPAPPFGNGNVDVDDLLTVINNWGPCPSGFVYCAGDAAVDQFNEVNVDDLLAIINGWGEGCGTMNTEIPQTIQECWNECNTRCPGDIECFNECFEGCINYLCKMELIECDE